MNIDIVEGASDKTEPALRRILASQGRLRIMIAAPVVVIETILYLMSPDNVAARLMALTSAYCIYVAALHVLVRYRQDIDSRTLLVATAVLDPIALSAWLVVTAEFGALISGFYLFTILGFGFRTGRPLMHLCQVTAIASFVLVFLSVPYWQQHPVVWVALLLPLIAVPMYAGGLISSLRVAREHAESESQAKSELLAKVSHELRTPLTGIISATELLAREVPGEIVARRSETILHLSNELLSEINDLLDEAKYGSQALSLAFAPVDLHDQVVLLREAIEATASKKGLEFQVVLDPAITDRVEADSHHIGRVMLNLASNAVRFTEHGKVRVDIELLAQSTGEYRVRFAVEDTGIGIPASFHSRIFQPFTQVEQGANRRFGGTGLGLALSRKLVELMGGEILFQSTEGKGSKFWFDLTLRRAAAAADAAPLPAPPPLAVEEPVTARRILVAEDNETNLLLLQELLLVDGHEVTTCTSGMEALEALTERDFDLLLLDYNLGDMDGVRVLQTYRFGRTDPAPALFLTADTTQLTAARLQEASCAGVLYKPITLGKLRRAIRDAEGGKPLRRGDGPVTTPAPAAAARATRPVLAAVAVSPLDAEVIAELRSVSSRPEFFPTLLAEAEHDITRNGQLIMEALARGNQAALRDAAHALKGVSANVGAVRLLALAGNLMAAQRDELESGRERWASDLQDAIRLTVSALRREAAEARSGGSGGGSASLHLH